MKEIIFCIFLLAATVAAFVVCDHQNKVSERAAYLAARYDLDRATALQFARQELSNKD